MDLAYLPWFYGEADDSPGLQGIGLLTIIFITYKLVTAYKKKRS